MHLIAFSFVGELVYGAACFIGGVVATLFFVRRNAKLASAATSAIATDAKAAASAVEKKI